MKKEYCILLCALGMVTSSLAQEKENIPKYKNQVSTNLLLPLFQSFDLNYERTVVNKWAIGLSGAIYGEGFSDFSTDSSGYYDRITNYEITPFVRFYLNGAQKKSHFFEFFGSIAEVDESGGYLRNVNEEGYGVYSIGTKTYTVGGLGAGYGYRFLLLKKKMVLEAQLGIRTNFNVDFFLLNGALVRTGIKVGYRF
ncbi:DUF3575 domain-containing protein [Zobellia barbeyronii]|uniref:DUF3575 domain-containing protein n=1 Tax=Zobellia barbeyronii TaxID=2748009 RepID=A0ABS5W9C0_9FLAO|nr:DUF3575 domain-containing protein [Zobellia barbeyronii]MBT2160023.1 DUF3575 domain-containing protein [Zobellia barbeyronii]